MEAEAEVEVEDEVEAKAEAEVEAETKIDTGYMGTGRIGGQTETMDIRE